MVKKEIYPWRIARRIIIFSLAFVVSGLILLVLPVYQYITQNNDNNNASSNLRVTSVSVNLEKPKQKKKKLKLETPKPKIMPNVLNSKRFDLNLDANSSTGMNIASNDVAGVLYDSSSVDVLPVRLRGRDPVASSAFYANSTSGLVELEVLIEADGKVARVMVLKEDPSGFGLGQSCADAVRSWVFRPAQVQGVNVRIRVVQPFAF